MIVGMGMVAMPVQDIIPHIQAVPWDVGWWVAQAMELVPQQPLFPEGVAVSDNRPARRGIQLTSIELLGSS